MSLSNPSQLLLRNEDLLQSNSPLVVGCPDSDFFSHLQAAAPMAKISSYQVNFAQHQSIASRFSEQINCVFSEHYQSEVKHDLAIIYFPKSKKEYQFLLAMLAPILADNAVILVVGENKGGVKSAEKLSNEYCLSSSKIDSARHCILYEIIFNNVASEFNLAQWYEHFIVKVNDLEIKVASLPGVFSNGELDNGTQLLLEHLPKGISGKVLDFGCGAGIIGSYVNKVNSNTEVDMLDVNALAIASAKQTLALNQLKGNVFASDGLSNVQGKYHAVLSNPPFHQGIKTNYQATETFLKGIKKHLNKNATLTIVANNFLKYAPIIKAEIAPCEQLANVKGFAIHHCKIQ
ncbi:methyltransferase [Thalassotalea sp. ND16A]|uniref:methyltransferase n=1 Tax=Thalassotalea sp. ND16A TaxID=1535422 RepID=UPI00051A7CAF|nr:methyltransferase [Thalassotalea sp. ND16A]KGJ99295.1 rRNA (guanine-N(2)-)-methyltransferase [Thalassotalea sp. ND16A]